MTKVGHYVYTVILKVIFNKNKSLCTIFLNLLGAYTFEISVIVWVL